VQFWGTALRKKVENFEYKIKYESEYLCGMRKEITTNYRVDKADKYHKHHKIQRNNMIFLLTNCLTHLYSTFLPTFLAASKYY
jgi:tRNA splicing ligase